jgi:hypothetical protein
MLTIDVVYLLKGSKQASRRERLATEGQTGLREARDGRARGVMFARLAQPDGEQQTPLI